MHVLTAAVADVDIRFMMVSLVNGASCVVAAIQRVKYPLNERWSTLHFPFSQGSYKTPSLKKSSEAFIMPLTRSCHNVLPLV